MGTRLELQSELEAILGSGNVYFQPPESATLTYPCIIYARTNLESVFSNNQAYVRKIRYQLTVITKDPDSILPFNILGLAKCRHERRFVQDGLYHDIFDLYY